MNRTAHVLTGVAAALWTLPVAPINGVAGSVAWVAATAGYAMAPDLDHGKSAAARMWGPVSRTASWFIQETLGHRGATHHPFAFGVTWFLMWLALAGHLVPWIEWALTVWGVDSAARFAGFAGDAAWFTVVAVSVGLAFAAVRVTGWLNLVSSVLVAAFIHALDLPLTWLPWAAAFGVAAHLLGDFITKRGLPWFGGRRIRLPLVSITTGKAAETLITGLLACVILISPPVRVFYAHLIRVLA